MVYVDTAIDCPVTNKSAIATEVLNSGALVRLHVEKRFFGNKATGRGVKDMKGRPSLPGNLR